MGERLVCNQEVTGSNPVFSTTLGLGRFTAVVHRFQGSHEFGTSLGVPWVP